MSEKKQYIPRLFDSVLSFALKSKGAVLVVGPKLCGKSTTCRKHAKTIIDLMPISTRKNLVEFAKNAPVEFLSQGKRPMLIDEWQHISFIWDQIKVEVDEAESSKTYSQNSKNAASIIVESVLIYIWPSKSLYVSKNQA